MTYEERIEAATKAYHQTQVYAVDVFVKAIIEAFLAGDTLYTIDTKMGLLVDTPEDGLRWCGEVVPLQPKGDT
jgi:hypothetical protein